MTIRQCFFCRGLLAVILSAFLAPCHAHSGKARFHAVVDTDGAADDLRTLCMLLGNREVEVLAVTTSIIAQTNCTLFTNETYKKTFFRSI